MNLIPNSVTSKFGRQILLARKNSPKTLLVVGLVGVGVSTYLACRATLKLEERTKAFEEEVNEHKAEKSVLKTSQYNRELAHIYAKHTGSMVRLYGPAIIVGAASVAALTGSHVTLTRRNTALMAAYGALQTSFEQFFTRVEEEVGADKARDMRNGIEREKISVDGKAPKTMAVKRKGYGSQYARLFDDYNKNYTKVPELNRNFILCQQNYLNDLLQKRGHVFLNEAYDYLGIDRSPEAQVVGWVINNQEGGDNYIDFGIYECIDGVYVNAGFINGVEPCILLDFNVDGVIWDKI